MGLKLAQLEPTLYVCPPTATLLSDRRKQNIMTDLISSKGRMATSGPSNRELMEKAEERKNSATNAASSTAAPAVRDEFVPSDVAKQAMSSEPFDQAKVDAIKQAIQDGQYPLDSRRIAESFLAVERMIGG